MHIDLPEKFYYKIGEVAEAFKVNTSLLAILGKRVQNVASQKRIKNGNRLYQKGCRNLSANSLLCQRRKAILWMVLNKKMKEKKGSNPETELTENQLVIAKLEKIKDELLRIKKSIE
jgi:hypothetical protein